jgi:hypothetical protein
MLSSPADTPGVRRRGQDSLRGRPDIKDVLHLTISQAPVDITVGDTDITGLRIVVPTRR